jgi:aminoglycoside 6'-N-acetyltransferase
MSITFRPLDASDLPRLATWLMEAHVREFYQPLPIARDEVVAEYAPLIGNDTPTICHLAVGDGVPFGYIQSYRNDAYPEWAELIQAHDGISLDLFIGDPAFLHRGIGRATLAAYLEQIAHPHFAESRAYIAHAIGNAAALRCSQAVGFRPVREFIEEGVRTVLLVRDARAPSAQEAAYLLPRPSG